MKNRLCDRPAVAEVLDHDPLQQSRCHAPIPDGIRIDDHNRAAGTNTKTRCFSAFHSAGSEQESFPV
jgi:hypothetical protein